MKRILYLLAAMIATVGVANAQIGNGTSWFRSSEELKCISASGNTFKFDMYGDGVTLNKTGNNQYSVTSNGSDSDFSSTPTAEYRKMGDKELLLFKDNKGNILKFYVKDDFYEPETVRGVSMILNGDYVDEQGTKYNFNDENVTIGGKKVMMTTDPSDPFLVEIDYVTYWWVVSTTGINLYNITDGEEGTVPSQIWHKLKNVSPKGRWTCLSDQVVNEAMLWFFDSNLLRIMRNEIYARHGYVFSSADLKAYFSKQPWYKPLNNNGAVKLTPIENLNVELIKGNIEARVGTDDVEIEEGLK